MFFFSSSSAKRLYRLARSILTTLFSKYSMILRYEPMSQGRKANFVNTREPAHQCDKLLSIIGDHYYFSYVPYNFSLLAVMAVHNFLSYIAINNVCLSAMPYLIMPKTKFYHQEK